MRARAALLIVLSCVAALVIWLVRRDHPEPNNTHGSSTIHTSSKPADTPLEPLTLTAPNPVQAARKALGTTSNVASGLAPDVPRSRVFGRVVDEHHAPVENEVVELDAYAQPWTFTASDTTKGSSIPSIENLALTTGADGIFVFETFAPADVMMAIDVQAQLHHARATHYFGSGKGQEPPLRPGDNDLGDIQVETYGAVSGRVVARDGTPIVHETVSVATRRASGSWKGETDDSGHYLIGAVPPGNQRVDVMVEGWLWKHVPDVVVEAGVTTNVPDIVLERAPEISGIVVDASGAGIPGVFVRAMPTDGSGGGAKATTNLDGSFTLRLAKDGPCSIEIPATGEFEPWGVGESGGPAMPFEPGRKDVRIVLTRAVRTTFRVVDRITRAPLHTFGILVREKPQSGYFKGSSIKDIAFTDHPDAEVRVPATPGASVVITGSPDHADIETEVVLDAGSDSVQTLALAPPSTIVGRVLMNGSPLAGASIALGPTWVDDQGNPSNAAVSAPHTVHREPDGYPGRLRKQTTRADGSFDFTDLAAGMYAMTIDAPGAGHVVMRGIRLAEASTSNVGDIQLVAGASVRGRLLMPTGDSPIGCNVLLDSRWGPLSEIKRPDGAFEFTALGAGAHTITWTGERKLAAPDDDPHVVHFDLAVGETREIVFDARGNDACTLVTHVLSNGVPAVGVELMVDWKGHSDSLGRTDADGKCEGRIDSALVFDLVAVSADNRELGDGGKGLQAVSGGRMERTIRIVTGTLVVELPTDLVAPQSGYVSLVLRGREGHERTLVALTTNSDTGGDGLPVWKGRTIDMGELPVGVFEGTLRFFRNEAQPGGEGPSKHVAVRPECVLPMTIEEGRETRIVVP